ncbi:MAG: tyrosine-type recombinase/integrase [Hyphomicrobiaceae bacterium]|nr:tyrosine-type recombinase/integrase [Hyphomicrobiaceae bacterium]
MAKGQKKLSDRTALSLSKPGRYSDGGGLFLRVSSKSSKSFSFRWIRNGEATEIGLGPYPALSLIAARERAEEFRVALANGCDPRSVRQGTSKQVTFAAAAEQYIQENEKGWKNDKHRAQWRMTLGEAYCDSILGRDVESIELADILNILQPIWHEKTETASRLRGRIEKVLDFAKVHGWRQGENPARWRGNLEAILVSPAKIKQVQHHAALDYAELPAFYARLVKRKALAARALEFAILTAARSSEVLEARWDEIDFERALWTVPADRMKASVEHLVPLSEAALELLRPLSDTRLNEYVFPGFKSDRPLSGMSMEMVLRRMKVETATVHGFRSSFRDWVGDETSYPERLAEQALAHQLKDKAEASYRRKTAIEKRRQMMEDWARYCLSIPIDPPTCSAGIRPPKPGYPPTCGAPR